MLTWTATLKNGTVIRERESEVKNSYLALDRPQVETFSLVDEDGEVKASVSPLNGESLFYRIRTVDFGQPTMNRFWMLGTRKGGEVKFTVVYGDGTKETYTQFNEAPHLYEPEWFSVET